MLFVPFRKEDFSTLHKKNSIHHAYIVYPFRNLFLIFAPFRNWHFGKQPPSDKPLSQYWTLQKISSIGGGVWIWYGPESAIVFTLHTQLRCRFDCEKTHVDWTVSCGAVSNREETWNLILVISTFRVKRDDLGLHNDNIRAMVEHRIGWLFLQIKLL